MRISNCHTLSPPLSQSLSVNLSSRLSYLSLYLPTSLYVSLSISLFIYLRHPFSSHLFHHHHFSPHSLLSVYLSSGTLSIHTSFLSPHPDHSLSLNTHFFLPPPLLLFPLSIFLPSPSLPFLSTQLTHPHSTPLCTLPSPRTPETSPTIPSPSTTPPHLTPANTRSTINHNTRSIFIPLSPLQAFAPKFEN